MHARARNGACCRVRGGPVERTVARRGGFLADGILALLVLGLALGEGLPTLAWTVRMQRTLERRQLALLTVANALDAQTALPAFALTEEEPLELPLNDAVRAELPQAALVRRVTATDRPGERRVVVALRWRDFQGTTPQEISLTGWVLP